MKKSILAGVVLGMLTCGMAHAADGQIKFTGSLTADACKIDPTSADQSVVMGNVAVSALDKGIGTKAAPTKFSIALTDCPATVTAAVVKFDGLSDSVNTDLLALDSDSTASGVGIEIADSLGAVIPVHEPSPSYALAEGSNTLDFIARYVSSAAKPTAGIANATSQFTLIYN
ncbi:fimbrial protein [Pseudescherichia sp.]|uniref:fimbrial protein n=1 Tax=Pseudescherichia sp. TaxID=2055881 RepID=UPI00289EA685|nr:fimbrial protein [Pseudescherichia sp.]